MSGSSRSGFRQAVPSLRRQHGRWPVARTPCCAAPRDLPGREGHLLADGACAVCATPADSRARLCRHGVPGLSPPTSRDGEGDCQKQNRRKFIWKTSFVHSRETKKPTMRKAGTNYPIAAIQVPGAPEEGFSPPGCSLWQVQQAALCAERNAPWQ